MLLACRRDDYKRNITLFADYYKDHQAELPFTIWRDAPVQHFDTRSGDYVWPVPTDICKAVPQIELLQDNSLRALHPSAQVSSCKASSQDEASCWASQLMQPFEIASGVTVAPISPSSKEVKSHDVLYEEASL